MSKVTKVTNNTKAPTNYQAEGQELKQVNGLKKISPTSD